MAMARKRAMAMTMVTREAGKQWQIWGRGQWQWQQGVAGNKEGDDDGNGKDVGDGKAMMVVGVQQQ
jgi:hypothetical protein